MHSHLLPARVKHEFQGMAAEILCIQVLFANCFQFYFHKIEKGIFQRGACEACLQVVLSRTFP